MPHQIFRFLKSQFFDTFWSILKKVLRIEKQFWLGLTTGRKCQSKWVWLWGSGFNDICRPLILSRVARYTNASVTHEVHNLMWQVQLSTDLGLLLSFAISKSNSNRIEVSKEDLKLNPTPFNFYFSSYLWCFSAIRLAQRKMALLTSDATINWLKAFHTYYLLLSRWSYD